MFFFAQGRCGELSQARLWRGGGRHPVEGGGNGRAEGEFPAYFRREIAFKKILGHYFFFFQALGRKEIPVSPSAPGSGGNVRLGRSELQELKEKVVFLYGNRACPRVQISNVCLVFGQHPWELLTPEPLTLEEEEEEEGGKKRKKILLKGSGKKMASHPTRLYAAR